MPDMNATYCMIAFRNSSSGKAIEIGVEERYLESDCLIYGFPFVVMKISVN